METTDQHARQLRDNEPVLQMINKIQPKTQESIQPMMGNVIIGGN